MKELFKFGGSVSSKTSLVVGIIGAVVLMLFWYIVTASNLVSPKILPNPADVICSIPTLISEKNLFGNIAYTISLNLVGYFYALVIAIPLGFDIGIYPIMNSMFQKPLEAIRFLPIPAVSGILIAALGLGFNMKASFLALGILIFVMPAVVQKVNDLQNKTNVKDNVLLETAITMNMSNWQKFRYVYFPYVMENMYNEIRNLVSISYSYIVIAECLNNDGGLGACINTMTRQSDMASVYALLFIIIIIGIIQDWLFKVMDPVIFKHHKV